MMSNTSSILVSSDGLPLYIYVQKDANEILREAQILYLRSMGAVLVEDPEYATVIIVLDVRLPSAAKLIYDYAEGPGAPARISPRIVLKHQWIEACLTASSQIPWDEYRILRPRFSAVVAEDSASRLGTSGEQLVPNLPPSCDTDLPCPSPGPTRTFTLPSVSSLSTGPKSKPSNAILHESTSDSTLKRKRHSKGASEQTLVGRTGSSRDSDKSPEPGVLETIRRGTGYAWTEPEDDFLITYVKWGLLKGLRRGEIARRIEPKLTVTQRNSSAIEQRVAYLRKEGRLTSENLQRQTSNQSTLASSIPSKIRRLEPTETPEAAMEGSPSQSTPTLTLQDDLQPDKEGDRPPNPPDPSTFEQTQRGSGYSFTDADKQFLAEYINWHLRRKPKTSLRGLATAAADLATHHSAGSWYNHLQRQRSEYTELVPRLKQLTSDKEAADDGDGDDGGIPSKKRRIGMPKAPEEAIDSDKDGDGPPDPPHRSTLEPDALGRYPFTEADKQFFTKYADWTLRRKPETTLYGLAAGAADLASHHSHLSWYNHLRKKWSDYIKRLPRLKHILSEGGAAEEGIVDEQGNSEPEMSAVPHREGKKRFTDDERRDMVAFLAEHPSIWNSEDKPEVPGEQPMTRQRAWELFDQLHLHYGRGAQSWYHYFRRHSEELEMMAWKLIKGKGNPGPSPARRHPDRTVPAPITPARRADPSRIARDCDTESVDAEPRSRREQYTNQDWDDVVDYLADHPTLMKNSPRRAQGSATKGELWERFARNHPGHSLTSWRQYYWSRQEALDTEAAARMEACDFQSHEGMNSATDISSDGEVEVGIGPSNRRNLPASPLDGASSDMAVEDLVDETHVGRRRPSSTTSWAERDRASGEAEGILERQLKIKSESR